MLAQLGPLKHHEQYDYLARFQRASISVLDFLQANWNWVNITTSHDHTPNGGLCGWNSLLTTASFRLVKYYNSPRLEGSVPLPDFRASPRPLRVCGASLGAAAPTAAPRLCGAHSAPSAPEPQGVAWVVFGAATAEERGGAGGGQNRHFPKRFFRQNMNCQIDSSGKIRICQIDFSGAI